MRKTVILHIGRHKSGTSALQNFLSGNAPALKERGIVYPVTGRLGRTGNPILAHHQLANCLRGIKTDNTDMRQLKAAFKAETEPFDKILLSSEAFQNFSDFWNLRNFFRGYRVHVICYLREYLSYLTSSYAQYVHNTGYALDFKSYVDNKNFDLQLFINRWKNFAKTTSFRLYDRSRLLNNDIIDDFLHTAEIDNSGFELPSADTNPSMSGNLLSLKLLMNLARAPELVSYRDLGEATRLRPGFKGKIWVPDADARFLREQSSYNRLLKLMVGDFDEPSFETGSKMFDVSTWVEDMQVLFAQESFKALKDDKFYNLISSAV